MDISSAYSAHQAASVFASPSRQSRENRPEAQRGQGDSVSISDEAYAALEASRNKADAAPAVAQSQVVLDASLPSDAASDVQESGKSLFDELKEYLADPIFAYAMEQMDKAIAKMGISEPQQAAVREQLEAVFRSGIPAEGEQTTAALNTLSENLKKNTGLDEDVIGDIMGKIAAIVEDAQKKQERAGVDDSDSGETLERAGSAQQARAESRDSDKELIDIPLIDWADEIYPPQYSSDYLSRNLEKTRKTFAEAAALDQQLLSGKISKQEYDFKFNELFRNNNFGEEWGQASEYLNLLTGKYNELLGEYKERFGDEFALHTMSKEELAQFKGDFYQRIGQDSRATALMDSLGIDRSKLSAG